MLFQLAQQDFERPCLQYHSPLDEKLFLLGTICSDKFFVKQSNLSGTKLFFPTANTFSSLRFNCFQLSQRKQTLKTIDILARVTEVELWKKFLLICTVKDAFERERKSSQCLFDLEEIV